METDRTLYGRGAEKKKKEASREQSLAHKRTLNEVQRTKGKLKTEKNM